MGMDFDSLGGGFLMWEVLGWAGLGKYGLVEGVWSLENIGICRWGLWALPLRELGGAG